MVPQRPISGDNVDDWESRKVNWFTKFIWPEGKDSPRMGIRFEACVDGVRISYGPGLGESPSPRLIPVEDLDVSLVDSVLKVAQRATELAAEQRTAAGASA
jgi:hypothetical protein